MRAQIDNRYVCRRCARKPRIGKKTKIKGKTELALTREETDFVLQQLQNAVMDAATSEQLHLASRVHESVLNQIPGKRLRD